MYEWLHWWTVRQDAGENLSKHTSCHPWDVGCYVKNSVRWYYCVPSTFTNILVIFPTFWSKLLCLQTTPVELREWSALFKNVATKQQRPGLQWLVPVFPSSVLTAILQMPSILFSGTPHTAHTTLCLSDWLWDTEWWQTPVTPALRRQRPMMENLSFQKKKTAPPPPPTSTTTY